MKPINVFCDLSDSEIEDVHNQMSTSTIKSGTIIYRPDEVANELFFLRNGSVEIYQTSRDGKRYVLSTVTHGTFFGEMAIVGRSVNTAYAAVVEQSILSRMDRASIEQMVTKHPLHGDRLKLVVHRSRSAVSVDIDDVFRLQVSIA